jgi:hypothetical protein
MENDGSILALSIRAMVERDLFTFLANAVWFNPVCCLNSNNKSAKSNFACSSSNACLNSAFGLASLNHFTVLAHLSSLLLFLADQYAFLIAFALRIFIL